MISLPIVDGELFIWRDRYIYKDHGIKIAQVITYVEDFIETVEYSILIQNRTTILTLAEFRLMVQSLVKHLKEIEEHE